MSFRVLSVETDPIEQGFGAEKYDLIIALNAIHAANNLDITLTNTRKLWRPVEKSILFEMSIRVGFTFGVLPDGG